MEVANEFLLYNIFPLDSTQSSGSPENVSNPYTIIFSVLWFIRFKVCPVNTPNSIKRELDEEDTSICLNISLKYVG